MLPERRKVHAYSNNAQVQYSSALGKPCFEGVIDRHIVNHKLQPGIKPGMCARQSGMVTVVPRRQFKLYGFNINVLIITVYNSVKENITRVAHGGAVVGRKS